MAHVYIIHIFLSDTLSDLDKFIYGEYSKHQLCSSWFDMAHVYIVFLKDKLILNGLGVMQGDQGALGHHLRPRQVPPWRVQ